MISLPLTLPCCWFQTRWAGLSVSETAQFYKYIYTKKFQISVSQSIRCCALVGYMILQLSWYNVIRANKKAMAFYQKNLTIYHKFVLFCILRYFSVHLGCKEWLFESLPVSDWSSQSPQCFQPVALSHHFHTVCSLTLLCAKVPGDQPFGKKKH